MGFLEEKNLYVSTDIETSGLNNLKHSILSIGSSVGDRIFYRELKPVNSNYEPEALEVNKLDFEKLQALGANPLRAFNEWVEWIICLKDEFKKDLVIFTGWNCVFDLGFINIYLYNLVQNRDIFYYTPIEIKSVAMAVLNLSPEMAKKDLVSSKLGIINESPHNALFDAIEQEKILKKLSLMILENK